MSSTHTPLSDADGLKMRRHRLKKNSQKETRHFAADPALARRFSLLPAAAVLTAFVVAIVLFYCLFSVLTPVSSAQASPAWTDSTLTSYGHSQHSKDASEQDDDPLLILYQSRRTIYAGESVNFKVVLPGESADLSAAPHVLSAKLVLSQFDLQAQNWTSARAVEDAQLLPRHQAQDEPQHEPQDEPQGSVLYATHSFPERGLYRLHFEITQAPIQDGQPTDTSASSESLQRYSYQTMVQVVGDSPVAFTFDDGPHENCTQQILTALSDVGGLGTFFITGYRLERKEGIELLQEMAAAGHQIGNHRYTHKIHSPEMSDTDFREEVIQTNQAIEEITGIAPDLFRFPWGDSSYSKRAIVKDLDMTICSWDENIADGGDYSALSEEKTGIYLDRIMQKVRPYHVMLFHDAENTYNSAQAISIALQQLHHKGYDFVTYEGLKELQQNRH